MTGETTTIVSHSRLPDDSRTVDTRFSCNICLDAVVEPVATQCGHLYCWPCLYRWLEPGMTPSERRSLGLLPHSYQSQDTNRRVCPVCKAGCSVSTLVPIYVRESDDDESTRTDRRGIHGSGSEITSSGGSSDDNEGGVPSHHDRLSITEDAGMITEDSSPASSSDGWNETSLSAERSTGLRQRIRVSSRDGSTSMSERSSSSMDSSSFILPSRPQPPSSPRELSPVSSTHTGNAMMTTPQRYTNNGWATQLTPNSHRGSLTHGLLLSIQQATTGNSGIPPLHRRGDGDEGIDGSDLTGAHSSGATEYLSRLLLMFSSFVILCLLLM